jgi:hypothetical protein
LVAGLYQTLTPEQKKVICSPFGHELQSKVGTTIGTLLEQRLRSSSHRISMRWWKKFSKGSTIRVRGQGDDKGFGDYSALFWRAWNAQIQVCADGPLLYGSV